MATQNSPRTLGANARTLCRLIDLFPEESCIVLRFFYEGCSEPVKQIQIWKNNHEEYPEELNYPTVERSREELFDFFDEYGHDSYRMTMEWNYGFGNSILINIQRPSTNLDY
ncbi:MAG: hypothetical protein K6A80_03150 [Saccharofermentans sp.]|nr:hypothetical protein [Saccharofermentans sp.]